MPNGSELVGYVMAGQRVEVYAGQHRVSLATGLRGSGGAARDMSVETAKELISLLTVAVQIVEGRQATSRTEVAS